MTGPSIDHRRRALLGAAAFSAIAAGVRPALAQDPQAGAAQNAAREWLALTDRLEGAASWKAAGAKFQGASPVGHWTNALQRVRGPLGALSTRAIDSTRFAKAIPGFPDGDYAIVVFRTSFANKAVSRETVTLEREAGVWRVVGYFIA